MDRRRPVTVLRSLGPALTVAAGLLLGACGGGGSGGEAEPVVIGSIPPDTGAPLGRDLENLDESGLTAFDRWPSACDLVDDQVVDALFPDNVDVARSPRSRRVTVLTIGGENRVETIPDADCTIRVGLPQEGLGLDDVNGGVRFETSVIAVGEPDAVDFAVGTKGGDPVDIAGVECLATSPSQILCHRETFAFQVSLDFRAHGQYVGSSDSPYESSGTTIVFQGGTERDEFVRERVLLPVVESILARDV